MAVPTRFELAIFRVTGERDKPLHHGTIGCGNRIWTSDLWVMSPTSYQAALFRDFKTFYISYGGGKGIRTPAPISWPPGFQDRSLQPDLGIPPIVLKQRKYSLVSVQALFYHTFRYLKILFFIFFHFSRLFTTILCIFCIFYTY